MGKNIEVLVTTEEGTYSVFFDKERFILSAVKQLIQDVHPSLVFICTADGWKWSS